MTDGTTPFLSRIRRSEHDIHVAQEQTQIEMLAELRHIRRALEALNEGSALFGTASRSSVQLEQGAKEVRLTVKGYDGSPLGPLGDEVLDEFGRLFREVESRQLDAWRETVERLGA